MIRGPKRPLAPLLPVKTASSRHRPKPLAVSVLLASLSLLVQPVSADELVEVAVLPVPDWQPLAVIPATETDLRCRQCQGKFIDPLAAVDTTVTPTEADLEVSADDSEVTESTLFFSGNVRVQQGYRFVTAD